MGPAGAGKGTMSELIEKHYHVAHISTGDMFRNEIKNNTELGQKAQGYMSQGLLVPDEVTFTSLIDGFAMLGKLDHAFSLIRRMVHIGCKPNY